MSPSCKFLYFDYLTDNDGEVSAALDLDGGALYMSAPVSFMRAAAIVAVARAYHQAHPKYGTGEGQKEILNGQLEWLHGVLGKTKARPDRESSWRKMLHHRDGMSDYRHSNDEPPKDWKKIFSFA